MYSFYGGHPGESFNIVQFFSTYSAMVTEFKRGTNSSVKFGEYVSLSNGDIYKRGYDYGNSSTGGAIKVGTFIGASNINSIDELAINDDNHLLIRYTDTNKQGNVSWNGKSNWFDLGDLTANISLSPNSTFSNIKWTGIGEIANNGSNIKISFIIPFCETVSKSVTSVQCLNGILTLKNDYYNISALNLKDGEKCTYTLRKTIFGLEFTVFIPFGEEQIPAEDFINISLKSLSIRFN